MSSAPSSSRFPFPVRHPLVAIGILVAITAGLAVFVPRVQIDSSMESLFLEDDPERDLYEQLKETFGEDEIIVLGLKVEEGDVFAPAVLEKIDHITNAIEELPAEFGVDRVVALTNVDDVRGYDGMLEPYPLIEDIPAPDDAEELARIRRDAADNELFLHNLVSEDRRSAAINVLLEHRAGNRHFKEVLVKKLRDIAEPHCQDVECHFAGIPVLTVYSSEYLRRDLATFIPITVLIIGIILWLTFRSVTGVILPLTTVGLAVGWTVAFVGLADRSITILASTVPSLLLAVGVSYSIHILAHYQTSTGATAAERASSTVRRVGLAVLLSGLTTFIGFASLLLNDVPQVQDFGLFAAFGVLGATLLALVGVPAALRLSNARARPSRQTTDSDRSGLLHTILDSLADLATGSPWLILVAAVAGLAASTYGALSVEVDTDYASYFKKDSDPVKGVNFMRDNLAGERPINVWITARSDGDEKDLVLEPRVMQLVERVESELTAHPLVNSTLSLAAYLKNMNEAYHDGDPKEYRIPKDRPTAVQYLMMYDRPEEIERYKSHDGNATLVVGRSSIISSTEVMLFVNSLRSKFADLDSSPKTSEAEFDIDVELVGSMQLLSKASIAIPIGLAKSLGLASALIFLIMIILYRSLRFAIVGILGNVLPVLTFFAFMSLADIPLSTGTSVAASVSLGIAVDDTIHFLTRYRHLRMTMHTKEAIRSTIHDVGRALTFTSIANACGFLVLTLSSFAPMTALGWLTAVTMGSALIADLLFIPALFLLIDRGPPTNERRAKANQAAKAGALP